MSEPVELSLDLEKAFLPAWAQEASGSRYADYKGEEPARARRDGSRGRDGFGRDAFNRGPRPDGRRGPRPGGPRPGGPPSGGGQRSSGGGPRRDRPAGGAPAGLAWDPQAGGDRRDRRRDGPRGGPRDRDYRPEPLIPVDIVLTPLPAGVQSLVRQIRISGRAFPLFEVAGLVIQKPDRYEVGLRVQKDKEGKVLQPLYACSLDDTVWLDEAQAIQHILKEHFDTFYETTRIPCDPPKGTYTFVAQCGLSGEILGPPNYHGYQDRLRQLHAERYSRLDFDAYRSRVRIVKDEAVVKEWIESRSFKFQYTTLNVPEPQVLESRQDVEQHFRETHAPNVIKPVEQMILRRENLARLPGPLQTALRVALDGERRFPMRTATALSGAFAGAGLHFFKRDRNIVHVAVARPHYLDLETQVVSDGVRRILAFLQENPKATRKVLIDALVPLREGQPAGPADPARPVEPPAPAAAPEATAPAAAAGPEAGTPEPPPAPAESPVPAEPVGTPELAALLTDLHWLVHQGHVIEFANGLMEVARRPVQPEKREPKGGRTEGNPRRERGPRPETSHWYRRKGLLLVNSQAVQPYAMAAALVG